MAKMSKDEIIEAVSNLSVLELSELVKALEEKFGVSAALPAAAPAASSQQPAASSVTTLCVLLADELFELRSRCTRAI